MDKPKGGRSKKADYISTHVRIPDPLKDRVEALKQLFFAGELEEYEDRVSRGLDLLNATEEQVDNADATQVLDLDQALDHARRILKFKKSARESVINLLTALYGVKVTVDDLLSKN